MLGNLFNKPKKTDEEIKAERLANLQAMIDKSPDLRRLVQYEHSGWKEFTGLLDDYIDKCKKRKAITALDRADDNAIYQLKLLDHEIFILNWVKQIPQQFLDEVESRIKEQREEEESNAKDE